MALSIIRPSIVGCALKEPEIGWVYFIIIIKRLIAMHHQQQSY